MICRTANFQNLFCDYAWAACIVMDGAIGGEDVLGNTACGAAGLDFIGQSDVVEQFFVKKFRAAAVPGMVGHVEDDILVAQDMSMRI